MSKRTEEVLQPGSRACGLAAQYHFRLSDFRTKQTCHNMGWRCPHSASYAVVLRDYQVKQFQLITEPTCLSHVDYTSAYAQMQSLGAGPMQRRTSHGHHSSGASASPRASTSPQSALVDTHRHIWGRCSRKYANTSTTPNVQGTKYNKAG